MTTKALQEEMKLRLIKPDIDRVDPMLKKITLEKRGKYWSVIRERKENGEAASGLSLYEAFQWISLMMKGHE